MPVYEFLCKECNTIYNFHTPSVNHTGVPKCPDCSNSKMEKQFSIFSTTNSNTVELEEDDILKSFSTLIESEATQFGSNEDLISNIEKFAKDSGVKFPEKVTNEIQKLKEGGDPNEIEATLSSYLMDESFSLEDVKLKILKSGKKINYNEKLYDLNEFI